VSFIQASAAASSKVNTVNGQSPDAQKNVSVDYGHFPNVRSEMESRFSPENLPKVSQVAGLSEQLLNMAREIADIATAQGDMTESQVSTLINSLQLDYNNKLGLKLDTTATAVNSALLENRTRAEIVAEARTGLATDTDVNAKLNASAVTGATSSSSASYVFTTAAVKTLLSGKLDSGARAANSLLFNGKTLAQVISQAQAGKVADTYKFGGLTPSAYMRSFVLEDGDGTERSIAHGKEIKLVEGKNIDINWTDTSTGSDADPYDLTFSVPDGSTSQKGAVQLSESTSSTSKTLAATSSAVKKAMDKASDGVSKGEAAQTSANSAKLKADSAYTLAQDAQSSIAANTVSTSFGGIKTYVLAKYELKRKEKLYAGAVRKGSELKTTIVRDQYLYSHNDASLTGSWMLMGSGANYKGSGSILHSMWLRIL